MEGWVSGRVALEERVCVKWGRQRRLDRSGWR